MKRNHIDYDAEVREDVRTATDLVLWCENNLGFLPDPDLPPYKARSKEAGKLNQGMRKRKVGLEDLKLAAAWCRRNKQPIESPYGLFFYVERARRTSAVQERVSDLATRVHEARSQEMSRLHVDDEAAIWVQRLTRARGADALRAVLDEWQEAGRG